MNRIIYKQGLYLQQIDYKRDENSSIASNVQYKYKSIAKADQVEINTFAIDLYLSDIHEYLQLL